MKPEIGASGPELTFTAIGGKYESVTELTLADLRGQKIVLYFYPKNNTPGWNIQACALRDAWSKIRGKAVVFGVSPDSIRSHTNFISKKDLPFGLISDVDKQLTEACGMWVEKKIFGKTYMGVERSTIIFDEEGKVHNILEKVKIKSHVEDILNAIS